MSTRKLDFPVFDADNHMYETPDALTKFLPPDYKDVIQYVQINGRTKIAVKGQISNYIPNPTFNKVAPPGAMEIEERNDSCSEGADLGVLLPVSAEGDQFLYIVVWEPAIDDGKDIKLC